MKPRLVELLVCPISKTPLELVEWESRSLYLSSQATDRIARLGQGPVLFSREIIAGALLNRSEKVFYPIYQGVPRMLRFPTGAGQEFAKEYADRIALDLPGFKMPDGKAMPGEKTVLRTFSSEWTNYDWDGKSYWSVSPDIMYKSMHFMLDLDNQLVKDKLVLEVGIGIGGIAHHMANIEECELVGIDLSYAVDSAYRHFGENPFLHLVQASAFAPPFREASFHLVYSQGVLHHTYSTKSAFDSVCWLPKTDGRLYLWVYHPYNELRSGVRPVLRLMENLVRPICWRLPQSLQSIMLVPIVFLYLIHQNFLVTRRSRLYVRYGWREAMHAARDRFTPRFVHRHTEEEVCRWFNDAGYTNVRGSSERTPPDFVAPSFMLATSVDGVRGRGDKSTGLSCAA